METIKHTCFECHFANLVWSITYVASRITAPHNISHRFTKWLSGVQKYLQPYVSLLGAAAICWSHWLCINDMVFDKKIISSPVRVVYLIIYWLRTWVILQKPGSQDLVITVCLFLEQAVTEFFTQGDG